MKAKALTNFRVSGKDDAIRLTPPKRLTLEQAIAYIDDDELVEVTPKSIRLRKRHLDPNERKKASRAPSRRLGDAPCRKRQGNWKPTDRCHPGQHDSPSQAKRLSSRLDRDPDAAPPPNPRPNRATQRPRLRRCHQPHQPFRACRSRQNCRCAAHNREDLREGQDHGR